MNETTARPGTCAGAPDNATEQATEFAEAVWDRYSTVWRVEVGGEPITGAQGNVLAFGSFNDAYDQAQRLNQHAGVVR